MIADYYQRELDRLRERGKAFARSHPALAPMLAAEGSDPDVERLLEGTAYLAALIREKLDDELPEVIHSLLGMAAPHYLRPLPSTTIMAFTPKRALRECLTIPRGTLLKSVEVEGTACRFSTCADVELAPLELTDVRFSRNRNGTGRLSFHFAALNLVPLARLTLSRLRLFFTGAYADAARRVMLCCRHCRQLRLVPEETASFAAPLVLSPSALRLAGFAPEEAIIPYPAQSFPGFRHIQEFFMLPERFCQLDVADFARWTTRGGGSRFALEMELSDLPEDCPAFRLEHVRLFATPAVNIFPLSGEPIRLDHRRDQYVIQPDSRNPRHYQVYSVDRVSGMMQGASAPREYRPFLAVNPGSSPLPVYALSSRLDDEGNRLCVRLAVSRTDRQPPVPEVLSLDLHCTNGRLPEKLHAGDVCKATDSSPELADFSNLRPPTAAALPPLGDNTLWRLLSHLYLNYLSVATAENLRSLLKLYIFGKSGDNTQQLAHISRVEGIEDVQVRPAQRAWRERLLRGQEISLRLKRENFAGDGDMYVFSAVLDAFLANYAAINTFTRLHVSDNAGRLLMAWPARLGQRILL